MYQSLMVSFYWVFVCVCVYIYNKGSFQLRLPSVGGGREEFV